MKWKNCNHRTIQHFWLIEDRSKPSLHRRNLVITVLKIFNLSTIHRRWRRKGGICELKWLPSKTQLTLDPLYKLSSRCTPMSKFHNELTISGVIQSCKLSRKTEKKLETCFGGNTIFLYSCILNHYCWKHVCVFVPLWNKPPTPTLPPIICL